MLTFAQTCCCVQCDSESLRTETQREKEHFEEECAELKEEQRNFVLPEILVLLLDHLPASHFAHIPSL